MNFVSILGTDPLMLRWLKKRIENGNLMPIFILLTLLGCSALLIVFGIHNRGSQTVVTATATLLAAMIYYAINAYFGLSSFSLKSAFPVEWAVNRSNSTVMPTSSPNSGFRAWEENEMFKRAVKANQIELDYGLNEKKILLDLMVASTFQWLAYEEFDWQAEAQNLKTSEGTLIRKGRLSDRNKSFVLKNSEVKLLLQGASNTFAESFQLGAFNEIILPKDSRVAVTSNSVAIKTSVFEITVEYSTEPQWSHNGDPKTNVMAMINGKPVESWMAYEGTFKATIHKYRSGDPNRKKYEEWFARLNDSIKRWYEATGRRLRTEGEIRQSMAQ